MSDTRRKDVNWNIGVGDRDGRYIWEQVQSAVLMDIRDELKLVTAEMRRMNSVIQCSNFIAIPQTLKRISANTSNLEKKKRKAKP